MTYSAVAKLCKAKHRLFFEVYCSAVYTHDISAALHYALLHCIAVVSPKSAKYARSLKIIYNRNRVCSHKANLQCMQYNSHNTCLKQYMLCLQCTAADGVNLPVMAKIVFMHVKVLPHILRPAHGVQTPQVQATLCTLCLVLIKSQ